MTQHIIITNSSFITNCEYREVITDDNATAELILWFNGSRCYSYTVTIQALHDFITAGNNDSWGRAYNQHIKRHGFSVIRLV